MEAERGRGIKISLKRSVPNANNRTYRRLSGPQAARIRPISAPAISGVAWPGLAWLTAYRLTYERPGPLGTLN